MLNKTLVIDASDSQRLRPLLGKSTLSNGSAASRESFGLGLGCGLILSKSKYDLVRMCSMLRTNEKAVDKMTREEIPLELKSSVPLQREAAVSTSGAL